MDRHEGFFVGSFTFALFLATWFLWRSTNKLWKAGEEEIAATRKLADAAMLSAGSERAWMSFENLYPGFFSGKIDGQTVERELSFNVRWINCGRSPAIDVETVIVKEIGPFDQVMPPLFEPPERPNSAGRSPIGPGLPVHSSKLGIGDADTDDFNNRRTKIYVYSRVKYRDVFNSSIVRTSEVCLEVSFSGVKPHPTMGLQPNLLIISVGPQNSAT